MILLENFNLHSCIKFISSSIYLIIPLIGIALSFFLGTFSKRNELKITALKERYEKLYVPFFSKLILNTGIMVPHLISPKELNELNLLFIKNSYLMGDKSLAALSDFYKNMMIFHRYAIEITSNPQTELPEPDYDEFDRAFFAIEEALLFEGSKISKQIKYPNIAETILKIHSQYFQK